MTRLKKADKTKAMNNFIDEIKIDGNISRSAKVIGISRRVVYLWVKEDCKFKDELEKAVTIGLHNFEFNEQRLLLLESLKQDGNVLNACRKVGITNKTYYNWIKKFKKFSCLANNAIAEGINKLDFEKRKVKVKIINELRKHGNRETACYKVGISTSTLKVWSCVDYEFRKAITNAVKESKESKKSNLVV